MTFVTFLNELSFPSGQVPPADAVAAVVRLARTLRALKEIHDETALHSSVRLPDIPLGEGNWLGPLMSASVERDEWRFIRSVQNRSPFALGIGDAFGPETEYRHGGFEAEGLGLSHAHNTLALSFSTLGWTDATIEVQRLHMDDAGEIDEETVSVNHASGPEHVTHNEVWIRSAWINNVVDGDDLWERRDELFPHLQFLPRVEPQVRMIKPGEVLLRSICSALMDLELAVSDWDVANHIYPAFRSKVSPEGENRSLKCQFTDLDGVVKVFDMHSRYTPGAGRIHFLCDRAQGRATVAHAGEKIP